MSSAESGDGSFYLQLIDNSEVIDAVHARRSPVIPATAGLNSMQLATIAGYLGPRSPQPPSPGAKGARVDHQLNSTEPAHAPPRLTGAHIARNRPGARGSAPEHADRVEFEFVEQRVNARR